MSLLSRLERAADPTNVERHTWKVVDTAGAVAEHLKQMLATKTGSSLTCPDYGVPDITGLLHDLNEASATLQRQLKASLQNYEPRLKNVQVRMVRAEVQGQPGLLFEISGHIILDDGRRQPVRFGTQLDDKGRLEISEF